MINQHRLMLPCGLVIAFSCLALYQPSLFGDGTEIGHDYSYFFPYLLSGYYWFLNNGFDIPWFTPALCGGIPHFPNPQSLYYSVPQLLLLLVDPLGSVIATYYIFGVLGFVGAYALSSLISRRPLVAVFTGLAFMTNGFFLARTQAGHLSFHAFMLLPGICYLLLHSATALQTAAQPTNRVLNSLQKHAAASVVAAGVLLAYFVHSGASVVVVPTGLCLILILGLMSSGVQVWVRLAFAGLIALCLCANKLVAVSQFMTLFPRDLYQLPGYGDLLTSIAVTFRGLTIPFSSAESNELLLNRSFLFGGEEFDYRIGVSLTIASGAILFSRSVKWDKKLCFKGGIVCLTCALPVLLNTYHPDWHATLKALPYFSSVSSLMRWNLVYLLPVILLASWVLNRCYQRWGQMASLPIMLVIVVTIGTPLMYGYKTAPRTYGTNTINSASVHAEQTREIPVILHLEESLVNGFRLSVVGTGDALTRGVSQVVCNEPAFGYRLENFRFDPVFEGEVFAVHGGAHNFYRPDCLLFPNENQCVKGERFSLEASNELKQLVSWQPFEFQQPIKQIVANFVTIASFWLIFGYFCFQVIRLVFRLEWRSK